MNDLDMLNTIDLLYDLDESRKQTIILLWAINEILTMTIRYPGWHELQIREVCTKALNHLDEEMLDD